MHNLLPSLPPVWRCGGAVPGELPGQCKILPGRKRGSGLGPHRDLDCFVVDNNGFILISERPQEMGRFLGEVDGALVTQLLGMGVFSQVTMYDYQAMCRPASHHHSASQPLVSENAQDCGGTSDISASPSLLLLPLCAWLLPPWLLR
ncbi:hypothetical protein CB1_000286004 [Camelus ferus]|nr:hypothetical protein CB1_000286004 [Camelus ferus]